MCSFPLAHDESIEGHILKMVSGQAGQHLLRLTGQNKCPKGRLPDNLGLAPLSVSVLPRHALITIFQYAFLEYLKYPC